MRRKSLGGTELSSGGFSRTPDSIEQRGTRVMNYEAMRQKKARLASIINAHEIPLELLPEMNCCSLVIHVFREIGKEKAVK